MGIKSPKGIFFKEKRRWHCTGLPSDWTSRMFSFKWHQCKRGNVWAPHATNRTKRKITDKDLHEESLSWWWIFWEISKRRFVLNQIFVVWCMSSWWKSRIPRHGLDEWAIQWVNKDNRVNPYECCERIYMTLSPCKWILWKKKSGFEAIHNLIEAICDNQAKTLTDI